MTIIARFTMNYVTVPITCPVTLVSAYGPSSLKVDWEDLSGDVARGPIVKHKLHYRKNGQSSFQTVHLDGSIRQYIITGQCQHVFGFVFYINGMFSLLITGIDILFFTETT